MTAAIEGRVPADTLAHRLMLVRNELGLSQREAALRTGVTYGEWQSMEAGREARALDTKVRKIAEATGYSRDWLMWGGPLNATPPDPEPAPFGSAGKQSPNGPKSRHSVYSVGGSFRAVA